MNKEYDSDVLIDFCKKAKINKYFLVDGVIKEEDYSLLEKVYENVYSHGPMRTSDLQKKSEDFLDIILANESLERGEFSPVEEVVKDLSQ